MEQDHAAFCPDQTHDLVRPLREILGRHQASIHDPAVQALAREVISRLDRRKAQAVDVPYAVAPADVVALCDALLATADRADDLVQAAMAQGMPIDVVHLRYIAEAAYQMGQRWEQDTATSAQVVIGAGRIYAIMRRLRGQFVSARVHLPDRFRAAFATAPGETHSIGLTMAADFLRRRGWQIDVKQGLSHQALVDEISHHAYPVIGLTASGRSKIFALARLIVALRVSHPGAWIMIGGNIVVEEPDIVALIDADFAVTTMDDTLAQMEQVMQGTAALHHG